MSPGVTQTTSSSAAAGTTTGSSSAANGTAPITENMFLQLLVAQLQNQDTSNPADSTQFVTQLAQFQTMEQSMNQGTDISAIRQDLDQIVASLGGATSTTTPSS